MANDYVTKSLSKTGYWSDRYAEAYLRYIGWYLMDDNVHIGAKYAVEPDGTASSIFEFELDEIPDNAVISSVHLTFQTALSAYQSYCMQGLTTPDISGSGSIDQRVLDYLTQSTRPSTLRIGIFNRFRGETYYWKEGFNTIPEAQRYTEEWYSYLQSATVVVEITYQAAQNSTVSYGTNNTWQKCNVYYGTGGSWQKCKAYFGTGGSWQEVK